MVCLWPEMRAVEEHSWLACAGDQSGGCHLGPQPEAFLGRVGGSGAARLGQRKPSPGPSAPFSPAPQHDGLVWPSEPSRVSRAVPEVRLGSVSLIPLRGSENEMRRSVAAFAADPLSVSGSASRDSLPAAPPRPSILSEHPVRPLRFAWVRGAPLSCSPGVFAKCSWDLGFCAFPQLLRNV